MDFFATVNINFVIILAGVPDNELWVDSKMVIF